MRWSSESRESSFTCAPFASAKRSIETDRSKASGAKERIDEKGVSGGGSEIDSS